MNDRELEQLLSDLAARAEIAEALAAYTEPGHCTAWCWECGWSVEGTMLPSDLHRLSSGHADDYGHPTTMEFKGSDLSLDVTKH